MVDSGNSYYFIVSRDFGGNSAGDCSALARIVYFISYADVKLPEILRFLAVIC